eukprot:1157890-Pelagomonas_calceolata.AAC.9
MAGGDLDLLGNLRGERKGGIVLFEELGGCIAPADHHFLCNNQACSSRAFSKSFCDHFLALFLRPVFMLVCVSRLWEVLCQAEKVTQP